MFENYVNEAMERGRCLPQWRTRLTSRDGLTLYAGVFGARPPEPASQVVLLFHGAGANMNVGYLDLARDIHTACGATVVVPDVRGHGMSQGPRGYAPNRQHVWYDMDDWLALIETSWPGADITLAGHSAGAIQCLNRMTEAEQPITKSVKQCIAIAPYFASTGRLRAQSGLDIGEFDLPRFSSRKGLITLVENCPEPHVVTFNFPPEAAKWCNLVPGYTAEMSAALSPRDIDRQLKQLTLPMTVLAAQEDELFPVGGLRRLVADAGNPAISFETVPHAHLSCLFHVGSHVSQALNQLESAA